MSRVRMNITLPEETYELLSREVDSRKRSRFIAEATVMLLRKSRAERLAREYQEAANDIRRVNRELEGAISDGLD